MRDENKLCKAAFSQPLFSFWSLLFVLMFSAKKNPTVGPLRNVRKTLFSLCHTSLQASGTSLLRAQLRVVYIRQVVLKCLSLHSWGSIHPSWPSLTAKCGCGSLANEQHCTICLAPTAGPPWGEGGAASKCQSNISVWLTEQKKRAFCSFFLPFQNDSDALFFGNNSKV